MTEADHKRLLETLAGVYAYYERDLTKFAVRVWVEDVGAYPIEAVERAFVRHRQDPERGQWLPKSADVLRHLVAAPSEAGTLAWRDLMAQVRTVGAAGRPRLTDEARSALDTVGGWSALCRSQEHELPHLQRRFEAAFAVFRQRAERVIEVPRLAAHIDRVLRLQ